MKIKKIEAQNQILKNFIKAKGLDIEIKSSGEKLKSKNIDKFVSKDLKLTIVYIIGSFGLILFSVFI